MIKYQLYNDNKSYQISQDNIVSKVKAFLIENYINPDKTLRPTKDNITTFAYEYDANIIKGLPAFILSGIWEATQKYDTNCHGKDLQQEFFFTFWKISNNDTSPALGGLDWYPCNENPIDLLEAIKRLKGIS